MGEISLFVSNGYRNLLSPIGPVLGLLLGVKLSLHPAVHVFEPGSTVLNTSSLATVVF